MRSKNHSTTNYTDIVKPIIEDEFISILKKNKCNFKVIRDHDLDSISTSGAIRRIDINGSIFHIERHIIDDDRKLVSFAKGRNLLIYEIRRMQVGDDSNKLVIYMRAAMTPNPNYVKAYTPNYKSKIGSIIKKIKEFLYF